MARKYAWKFMCIFPLYTNTLNSFKCMQGSPLFVTHCHVLKKGLLSENRNKRLTEMHPRRVKFPCDRDEIKVWGERFKTIGGGGRDYEGYGKEEMETLYYSVWKLVKNIYWKCIGENQCCVIFLLTISEDYQQPIHHPLSISFGVTLVSAWNTAQPPLL